MSDETESDFPAAWRPDQDDPPTIRGNVVSVSLSPDFGFGPYPIVTIKNDTGEHAIHAMHQILRTELAKRRPGPGDDLEVTYQGKRAPKSGNGNAFHVYRVTGGKEPEFNWDRELSEDDRRAQSSSAPPIPPSTTEARAEAAQAAAETFGDAPPF
jgi:hypothetical protein